MRITATFEKRHRSASRLLLGKVLCSVPSVPCLRKSPIETTVFSVAAGIRFQKWQMQTKIIQSYYVFIWVSVCCSDMLIFIFAWPKSQTERKSSWLLSNSCQEISQLIRVCSCPRQPLPAQNFFYVSSLMFQHSGKSTWGFFKWVKPGIVWTGW